MAQHIRVGMIGTSWWTELMLLPSLQSHPQAEVVAICGRNKDRAETVAAQFQIANVFLNVQEMLQTANLNAVVIATPDDSHHALVMKALESGLHVFCEKPLALNAQQAEEMYEAAKARNLVHMVNFTYRWMPFYQYLHDLIKEGYVGRCFDCDFRFSAGFARDPSEQWRFDPKRANGVLGDLGSHVIDLARWLIGEISEVSAQLGALIPRRSATGVLLESANDSALLLVRFANNAQGIIHVSAVEHVADRAFQHQVRIAGEDGMLELDFTFMGTEAGAIIQGARKQDQTFQKLEVPDRYWGDSSKNDPMGVYRQQPVGCRLFMDAILGHQMPTPTFHDGYQVQRVVDAALESYRLGRRVTVFEQELA